jgi:hypothetical protein
MREMARERPLAVTVRGRSMAPRLADGARVEIAPARVYWPGDVVAFRSASGSLLLHRVLGYRLHAGRPALVVRGDRCPGPDSPVPLDRVLGRTVAPLAAGLRFRAALAFLALAARRLPRLVTRAGAKSGLAERGRRG